MKLEEVDSVWSQFLQRYCICCILSWDICWAQISTCLVKSFPRSAIVYCVLLWSINRKDTTHCTVVELKEVFTACTALGCVGALCPKNMKHAHIVHTHHSMNSCNQHYTFNSNNSSSERRNVYTSRYWHADSAVVCVSPNWRLFTVCSLVLWAMYTNVMARDQNYVSTVSNYIASIPPHKRLQ